jgi:hypothetical protein
MRLSFEAEFGPTKPPPNKKPRCSGYNHKRNCLLPIHVRKIVQLRPFAINNSPETGLCDATSPGLPTSQPVQNTFSGTYTISDGLR